MRTIKISNPEQSGFYVDNGLTPINIYHSNGKWIWEFNKDEQNKIIYKKYCDFHRERMLKRYIERKKIKRSNS